MDKPRSILVATDFSRDAELAASRAVALAGRAEREVAHRMLAARADHQQVGRRRVFDHRLQQAADHDAGREPAIGARLERRSQLGHRPLGP